MSFSFFLQNIQGNYVYCNVRTRSKARYLFDEIHKNGNTIVMVTHEEDVARRAKRVVRMKDGMIDLGVNSVLGV